MFMFTLAQKGRHCRECIITCVIARGLHVRNERNKKQKAGVTCRLASLYERPAHLHIGQAHLQMVFNHIWVGTYRGNLLQLLPILGPPKPASVDASYVAYVFGLALGNLFPTMVGGLKLSSFLQRHFAIR